MQEEQWKRMDFANSHVEDIRAAIKSDIEKYIDEDLQFFVGCDSQPFRGGIRYITAVSIIRAKKGGSCFYLTHDDKPVEMMTRLWNETQKSVTLALELNEWLEEFGHAVFEIHCDINPDAKHKSNKAFNMCRGYVESMGFDCVCKPHAWAASKVADKRTRI